ncbi:MAG: DUF4296 domain-containing protein [Bacteroidales bacterium]|nr:DUF4296 domain-containing protein [Bacteroidales bacterium]
MEMLFAEFYRADATIELLNETASPVDLDSMRVYLPIVESNGYTKDEFRASLEHYLHHPGRLSKIFDHVKARLEQEAERPSVIQEEERDLDEMGREVVEAGEGTEPAIERIREERRLEGKQPQRPKKSRKKISKEDLKQLEEELR